MKEQDSLAAGAETGRRILVVDDDRDALQILSDFLEVRGHECVQAADGHEALTRFHDEGPFDIVLLDVMMPGIDGLEVCRRIKASTAGVLTPVLLISARSDTRSRVAGLYGGADDYMSKPVDLRELAARLEALLRVRDRYTELAERRGEALEAALEDGLTGLLGADYFKRRLGEEIARADRYGLPLCVVVADLLGLPEPDAGADPAEGGRDSFAGPADALVRAAGAAMRSAVRGQDLVARIRRSRFAILVPHTPRRALQGMIRRLDEAVAAVAADPARPEAGEAGLSLKIGSAELGPRMDAESLLARAEPR